MFRGDKTTINDLIDFVNDKIDI